MNELVEKKTAALLQALAKNKGKCVCFCGSSGAGKTTAALSYIQNHSEDNVILLDGDHVRSTLSPDLTWTDEDRREQNRRVAAVAMIMMDQGCDVVISTIRADIAHKYLIDAGYDAVLHLLTEKC